ncbi:4Fe-4S dicluster domain-containing protein, partial [bacterium]
YETCFCSSLGYDLKNNDVADVFFYKISDDEYLALASKKGEQLLEQAGLDKIEASNEQLDKLDKQIEEFKNKFKINFKLNSDLLILKDIFNDEYFEKVAFKCLECGICSFLCPTCHCFTIDDTKCKNDGYRMRCWDYCLNPDFTLMAGGHNPRETKTSRIRQRFLHKAFYFKEREDLLGCVGCGRCLVKCPVAMDISEALKHIRGAFDGQ